MPVSRYGQLITFSIEGDASAGWTRYTVHVNDTVAKIAARLGHREYANRIRDENGIRSVSTVLLHKPRKRGDRTTIRVPGALRDSLSFSVLAGDQPPHITGGYARLTTVNRPERVGLTMFDGYDPMTMEVPIRFENFIEGAGADIEDDIALLERMAGRGAFEGAGTTPPPIIRVSTTGASGEVVPLIPSNYQWSPQNPSAPLWRIAGLEWDADSLRNSSGNRVRQLATVTLQQHTRLDLVVRRR